MAFMPHGQCFFWSPALIGAHVSADAMIMLAYYSIPATIFYFVRRRSDLAFHWMFLMFAAFIFLCGTTHAMEIWTVWVPDYWLEAGVKIMTALVSVVTAVALIPLVPRALALRSPIELERLNRMLRQEIAERERVEVELRQMTARLEEQNRELGDFARVASHDLQEPLRKVELFSERLSRNLGDGVPEKAAESIERLRNAAGRMRALITDLLQLSRVSTHGGDFQEVDLAEVAREVLDDLEASIVESGASVDVGDLPTIEADPTQMRQLLQNLIGNAVKYHQPGVAPTVRVRGDTVDWRGTARIIVEDDGIGFAPEHAERIFGAFERLHGRGEFEGTGIGLALCRKIVERHGGAISAASVPGKGAAFTVELPVRATAVDPAAEPVAPGRRTSPVSG